MREAAKKEESRPDSSIAHHGRNVNSFLAIVDILRSRLIAAEELAPLGLHELADDAFALCGIPIPVMVDIGGHGSPEYQG